MHPFVCSQSLVHSNLNVSPLPAIQCDLFDICAAMKSIFRTFSFRSMTLVKSRITATYDISSIFSTTCLFLNCGGIRVQEFSLYLRLALGLRRCAPCGAGCSSSISTSIGIPRARGYTLGLKHSCLADPT